MKCGSRITAKRPPNMNAGVLTKGGETAGAIQERTTGMLLLDDCLGCRPFDCRLSLVNCRLLPDLVNNEVATDPTSAGSGARR